MEIKRKHISLLILLFATSLFSCQRKTEGGQETIDRADETIDFEKLENIPLSSADVGEFPFYITPPTGYHFDGSVGEMNFDEIYHFYSDSSTLSVGGKYYECPIIKDVPKYKKQDTLYNDSLILANLDQQIRDLGGIDTRLPHKYSNSVHTENVVDSVKRYIIRTTKGNIWIDLICMQTPRQINYSVIFEGRITEPVNIVKAERLRYALENYGKVVVYVNFADGKISLEPDGVKAVDEFVKLMRLDPNLRLSIEGHTDEVGTEEYARRLSNERLLTIINQMKKSGIKEYRLKKMAYGSSRMVAGNTTNPERAKNKRIELIKTNIDETSLRNAIDKDGKAVLQITFETGKYIIKPDGLDIIDQIAKLLTTDSKLKLSIEGHTDNVGSALTNKKLSIDRANAVLERLVELGIDRRRLKSTGYGLERPIVPNNSQENKAKNRRVEIVKIE